jgi:hypothetical protein
MPQKINKRIWQKSIQVVHQRIRHTSLSPEIDNQKPDMVAHACNLITKETEVKVLQVQVHTGLHNKLQANLGYTMTACLKKKKVKYKERT